MRFWTAIEAGWKWISAELKPEIAVAEQDAIAVLDALRPTAVAIASQLGSKGLEIVADAVAAADAAGGTPGDKLSAARTKALADLASAGHDVSGIGLAALNAAIEAMVVASHAQPTVLPTNHAYPVHTLGS